MDNALALKSQQNLEYSLNDETGLISYFSGYKHFRGCEAVSSKFSEQKNLKIENIYLMVKLFDNHNKKRPFS